MIKKSNLLRYPQGYNWCVFNRMMTVLMPFLAYLTLLGTALWGLVNGLYAYIWSAASGFVLLTLVRKWINQPRPYEAWGVSLLGKDSSGEGECQPPCLSAFIISWHARKSSWAWFCSIITSSRSGSSLGWRSLSQGCLDLAMPVGSSGNSLLYFVKKQSKWAWLVTTYGSKATFLSCKVLRALV